MKNILYILPILLFADSSHAVDVKEILKGVINAEAEQTQKRLNYKLEYGDRVLNSGERYELDDLENIKKNTPIYVNEATDLAKQLDPSLNIPTVRTPIHIYKDNPELFEENPLIILKRCTDTNPLECYKLPDNANVTGAPKAVDKVPRITPCDANDPC